jgi:hypothetical protein
MLTAVPAIRVIPRPCLCWIHDEATQHEPRMEICSSRSVALDSRAAQSEYSCDREPKIKVTIS